MLSVPGGSTCAACAKETGCKYTPMLTHVTGGRFHGSGLLVAPTFVSILESLNEFAADCDAQLVVQGSLQWSTEDGATNASTEGRAVRLLVQTQAGVCDASCIAAVNETNSEPCGPDGACDCFFDKVGAADQESMAWGHTLLAAARNKTTRSDPSYFTEPPPQCNLTAVNATRCPDTELGERLTTLLETFHEFGCHGRVVLPGSPPFNDPVVTVAPYTPSAETADQPTVLDRLNFPSRSLPVKTGASRPFGMAEYAAPDWVVAVPPLLDAFGLLSARLSPSIRVADVLSRAVGTPSFEVNRAGAVRNRYFRADPTLVEALEKLLQLAAAAGSPVVLERVYMTQSEAEALGEPIGLHQAGTAARVAYAEAGGAHRQLDLALLAIRAFRGAVTMAGRGMGIGLYPNSLYLDVRPAGASGEPLHGWSYDSRVLSAEEFESWAQGHYALASGLIPSVDIRVQLGGVKGGCARASPLGPPTTPQSRYYSTAGGAGTVTVAATDFCRSSAAARTAHFDAAWAHVSKLYEYTDARRQRPRAEIEAALRGCLMSCDPGSLAAPMPGSGVASKIAACDNAMHWLLAMNFGDTANNCGLSTAGSGLKESACFWGKCVEETAMHGLLNPGVTFRRELVTATAKDPTCGAEEPVYGTQNPSPIPDLIRRLFAAHCSGRVTVWVASVKELLAMERLLRVLMVFNDGVDLVDIRTRSTARVAVTEATAGMVESWTPTLCRLQAREYIAPYTVTVSA